MIIFNNFFKKISIFKSIYEKKISFILISIILLILIIRICIYKPKKETFLKYFTTVRYTTPDKYIITNKKDCINKLYICKLKPSILEEGCSSCKQINSQCVHFTKDTSIEVDGRFVNIKANKEDEGYCLTGFNTPDRTCKTWGFWILIALDDHSFIWVCKCKYPNIIGQKTILDDCNEKQVCLNGVLKNIDLGLVDSLKCDCNEGYKNWGENNLHCRKSFLFIDGAYYKFDESGNGSELTASEYFSKFQNYKKTWLTLLPPSFNMPEIIVVNPFFLSLSASKNAFVDDLISYRSETNFLQTERVPMFTKHLFHGSDSLYLQSDQELDWNDNVKFMDDCRGTWFFSKIVVDPTDDDVNWKKLPWGYVYGHYFFDGRSMTNAHAFMNWIFTDPHTDIFQGYLGAILIKNTWFFAPYPNILINLKTIEFKGDNVITKDGNIAYSDSQFQKYKQTDINVFDMLDQEKGIEFEAKYKAPLYHLPIVYKHGSKFYVDSSETYALNRVYLPTNIPTENPHVNGIIVIQQEAPNSQNYILTNLKGSLNQEVVEKFRSYFIDKFPQLKNEIRKINSRSTVSTASFIEYLISVGPAFQSHRNRYIPYQMQLPIPLRWDEKNKTNYQIKILAPLFSKNPATPNKNFIEGPSESVMLHLGESYPKYNLPKQDSNIELPPDDEMPFLKYFNKRKILEIQDENEEELTSKRIKL